MLAWCGATSSNNFAGLCRFALAFSRRVPYTSDMTSTRTTYRLAERFLELREAGHTLNACAVGLHLHAAELGATARDLTRVQWLLRFALC